MLKHVRKGEFKNFKMVRDNFFGLDDNIWLVD